MHGANPSEAKTIRNQKPADDRVALLTDCGAGFLNELECFVLWFMLMASYPSA